MLGYKIINIFLKNLITFIFILLLISFSLSWFVPEVRRVAIAIIQSSIKIIDKSFENEISKSTNSKKELIYYLRILSDKLPFNSLWLLISVLIGYIFGIISSWGFNLYGLTFFFYLIPAGSILAGGICAVLFFLICKGFHILPSGNMFLNGLLGAIVITYVVNIVPFHAADFNGLGYFLAYINPANIPLEFNGKTVYPPAFIGYILSLIEFLGPLLAGILIFSVIKDEPYDKENKKFMDEIVTLEKFIADDYTNSTILETVENLIKNKKYIDSAKALNSTDVCDKNSAKSMIKIKLSKSPVSNLHHIAFEVSEGEMEKKDNGTEEIKFEEVSDKSLKFYFNSTENLDTLKK